MTEPEYGPLQGLIGKWRGAKGVDIAPEPKGRDREEYYETLFFEPIGGLLNAKQQKVYALRYHQVVYRKSNDEVLHNETGYWMWAPESRTVMHSLTIPRGVCILAGGEYLSPSSESEASIEVAAKLDDPDWGIVQSPFMRDNASTLAFSQKVTVDGDSLSYSETTTLEIYGQTFQHTDDNVLQREKD